MSESVEDDDRVDVADAGLSTGLNFCNVLVAATLLQLANWLVGVERVLSR